MYFSLGNIKSLEMMYSDKMNQHNTKGELVFWISVHPSLSKLYVKRSLEEIYNIEVVSVELDSEFFETEVLVGMYSIFKKTVQNRW